MKTKQTREKEISLIVHITWFPVGKHWSNLIEHPNLGNNFSFLFFLLAGRHYFREFLRSEYSEENFLFWMSCESLKNEQNPDIIEEKARLIYEDYISILSPKEVNIISFDWSFSTRWVLQVSLDSRVREVINKNMVEPSPHTFDEAQLQIYTLMHRDSYPRFINSQFYRRLIRNEAEKTWLDSIRPPGFSLDPQRVCVCVFFFLSSRHIPQCGRTLLSRVDVDVESKRNVVILPKKIKSDAQTHHRRYWIKSFL